MRTTLDIRDDLLDRVRERAEARKISYGEAASDVLERGFNSEIPTRWENGILIFAPGRQGAVTTDHAMKLKDQMESDCT